jgi:hypothetical protein
MRKTELDKATIDELVEHFITLCIAQDREILRGDVARANKLYDEIDAVKRELQLRPGDQRRSLIALYAHENMHVRLKAANATLAIVPSAARAALEDIKASNWQPQAAEASHSLWTLDRGIFKPT